ncbi:IS5 family transposase [Sphingomonas bacterium]|uniref:IS5 family transposase n=1 Tax=Sphingomonas bacterium TaxID=1895847 RepID=UPI0020C6AC63|nr:IS5 family transposase [Sphingomonas bacterium]
MSDEQWVAIDPQIPKLYRGKRRVDDRRVISGIMHRLRDGCRWRALPEVHDPYTTAFNRYNRWSERGLWQAIFAAGGERQGTRDGDDRQQLGQGAPLSGLRKGGERGQAIGRSRGGRTTKLHILVDEQGRPHVLKLMPGGKHPTSARRSTWSPPRARAGNCSPVAPMMAMRSVARSPTKAHARLSPTGVTG